MDVTWDDPTSDVLGQVRHTYFLLSDREIAELENPHYGWETDITCTSERFADAWWKNTVSQVCFASKNLSYRIDRVDSRYTLLSRNESTGEETVLHTEYKHFINTGLDSRYAYGHFGLSFAGGRLFFGVQDQILSLIPTESAPRVEYTHNTAGTGTYIKGMILRPEGMLATLSDHEGTQTVTELTITTVLPSPHRHSYIESVTAPTCTETGISQWQCSCGLTCQGAPTAAIGHALQQTELKKATVFSDGFYTESCTRCDHSRTTLLEKLPLKTWLQENKRMLLYIGIESFLVIVLIVNVVLLRKEKNQAKPPDAPQ